MTATSTLDRASGAPAPSVSTARFVGLLYLSLAIIAPFSMMFVPSKVLVAQDASATATQLLAHQGLFRAGIGADATVFLIEIVLTALLYRMFEPVNRTLSMMAAFSRLAMTVIQGANLALHVMALRLAAGPHGNLALPLLEAHADVVLIWQAFFALHCALLGYLVYRSGYFPRVLGGLILLASAGYFSDSFGRFLVPGYGDHFGWVVALPAFVGELSFTLWLLIKGVKPPHAIEPKTSAA